MSAKPPFADMQPTNVAFDQPSPRLWPPAAARAAQWLVLAGLWLGWLLSPLVIGFIQGSATPVKRYGRTLAQCARMMLAMARKDVIYRNALRKLSGEAGRQEQVEGECTHCGRCCIDHQCVFLTMHDSGDGQAPRSACNIYGSRFFRWTSCGLYPIAGADIAAYDCPSFVSRPAGSFRTIPIRSANDANKRHVA
jgi:hypothetical protein